MREAAAIITANGATLAGDRPLPPTPTPTRTRTRARVVDHCGIRQYMNVSDEAVSGGLLLRCVAFLFSGVILALDRMEKGQGDRSAVQEARREYPQSRRRAPYEYPSQYPHQHPSQYPVSVPSEYPPSTLRVPPRVG